MNGTTLAGPAPMPDNEDKGRSVTPGSGLPQSQGSPPPASEPPKPPSPPKQSSSLPPPPPSPPPPQAGGSVVSPPPAQEVDIRTLVSDAKSLKSSGGLGVEPETFSPTDLAGDAAFTPQVDVSAKASISKKRVLFISLGIIVTLGIVAGAVYFFVLPFFSTQAPEVVVDETPTLPPPPPPPPTEPSFVHTSFLIESDASENALLGSLELSQILAVQAGGSFPSGSIKEVSFAIGGNPVNSQDFLELIFPGLDGELFNQDFTNFVYFDDNGAWPGYIFLLEDPVSNEAAIAAVAASVENISNITSLYITPPGPADVGGFKDGSVNSVGTRYMSFDLDGASFNYGWSGKYLILSTSFPGFQKALSLLGS